MNLMPGLEKWVNTLPMKFASWAFAFDAILVSFMARQPPCGLFFAIRYSTENGGRLPHFSPPFLSVGSPDIEKWVNSRQRTALTSQCVCDSMFASTQRRIQYG
jgi:hypothetical protein